MISVLRNNSKALNLQERNLNWKMTKLKHDDNNPFDTKGENMKVNSRVRNRNDSLKANSTGSKGILDKPYSTLEYNDSKYKPNQPTQIRQNGIT
jgi:hypothetical protein